VLSYLKECEFREKYIKECAQGRIVTHPPLPEEAELMEAQNSIGGADAQYIITKQIGTGGQANVFLAMDKNSDSRWVAIKLYRGDVRNLKPFKKEVGALTSLRHPNILSYYGTPEAKDCAAVVLELAETDIKNKYFPDLYGKSQEGVCFDKVAEIMTSVSKALKETHSVKHPVTGRSLVHRDVKVNNVFITEDGTIKLGDYGNSLLIEQTVGLTRAVTNFTGYEPCVSPEALGNKDNLVPLKHITPQLDTYSAGVMIYHLATGRGPFKEGEGVAARNEENWGPRLVNLEDVDPKLEYFSKLMKRCLDPDFDVDKSNNGNVRPADGEELLYEVRIASNYAAVKAYETALDKASKKVEDDFSISADDIKKVHKALDGVHEVLSDISDDKREAHIGANFGMNLDAVVADEANLGNSRSIFRGMTDNYKELVADCYNHIKEFTKTINAKTDAGTPADAEDMEKVKRYKGLMRALPRLAPKS
jgi:serine/threonine protein kinase